MRVPFKMIVFGGHFYGSRACNAFSTQVSLLPLVNLFFFLLQENKINNKKSISGAQI